MRNTLYQIICRNNNIQLPINTVCNTYMKRFKLNKYDGTILWLSKSNNSNIYSSSIILQNDNKLYYEKIKLENDKILSYSFYNNHVKTDIIPPEIYDLI
jgi:uncharacterized protein (DUF2147 family)